MLFPTVVCLAISALLPGTKGSLQILSGATWTDTVQHKHVQAHGGGILKVNDTYYWVGEDKTNGSAFQNINCYSSTNLVDWAFVRSILTRTGSGDLGANRVIERPKIVFNKKTNLYVLLMHIDDSSYKEAKVGFATSPSACGALYTYKGSTQPLGFQSRDMGVFIDDDEKGYLLTEDRKNGLRIDSLSDDYLTVEKSVKLWSESIEAPAMLKKDGTYFMFGSHLTGWDPNDNVYSTASSISGPWSAWKGFADSGSKTYNSQTNFILPVGKTAIYMGDRWISSNLQRSTYIWLPLTISGTTVTMKNSNAWAIDMQTGAVTQGGAGTSYEGESATLGGGAKHVSCDACSGKDAVGYIGGTDSGTATFSNIAGSGNGRTTVQIKYENGDKSPRYAKISVNGGADETLAFLGEAKSPGSSALNVELKSGANTIKIAGDGSGWGPDIDRLIVA